MKIVTSFAVFVCMLQLICVSPASGQLMSEDFDSYTTGVRLPDPPYVESTITGISGDNPGIDALTDPADGSNTVGGRTGANGSHHATMRALTPGGAPSFIELRADIMTDWSNPGAVDNLLYIASGNGDRDLLIGLNDGLLSAFFEDSITSGSQRLRGNGGSVVTADTWYTVRATVTFPGSDPNGLLSAEWKLASDPDTSFAAMVGGDSNTTVSAGDLTEANFFHWELRNSGGGSGGSYADNISIVVPEPVSLALMGLGALLLSWRCRAR
ncbi:MAG: PEP-CTERM sorting domain-containing protein [Pirellulaceae bacterium]|nr:PEP-CTERM sorting domain-containing protein [Pirellulaceae bacterium]